MRVHTKLFLLISTVLRRVIEATEADGHDDNDSERRWTADNYAKTAIES